MNARSQVRGSRTPRVWAPYLVLVVGVLLTAVATAYVARTTHSSDRARFEYAVGKTCDRIQDRLDMYIASLRGASALFASHQEVSRDQFRAYVERLDVPHHYPGIQGIGFAPDLQLADTDALIATMRRTGAPSFVLWPAGERAHYDPIIYLEPLDQRNAAALGYDMSTDPVRRAAMEQARDTGAPAASGKVTLAQEIDDHKQTGFLIYVPVYRGDQLPATVRDRRAALQGFVYGAFRVDDLLAGVFGTEMPHRVDFQVFDGAELAAAQLMHQSYPGEFPREPARFNAERRVEVGGHTWSLLFVNRPEWEWVAGGGLLPLVLVCGIGVSAVLFRVMRAQSQARATAEHIAADLRQSEAALRESDVRLRRLTESNIIGLIVRDMHGRIIEANQAFLEMVGYTRDDFVAGRLSWTDITPPENRHLDDAAMEEMRTTGRHAPFETEFVRKGGARVPVLVGTAYLGGPDEIGVGFLLDLTERKRAEETQRFLAEASGIFGSSLEVETTLASLASLVVPRLADWCLVHLADSNGSAHLATVVHADPAQQKLMREIHRRYPSPPEQMRGYSRVLRTGQSELLNDIPDARLQAMAEDVTHLAMLRALGLRSNLCVPLLARQQVLGALTLATAESGRQYGQADLAMAEELARRAAAAIDNARLYHELQATDRRKDEFLAMLGHELRNPLGAISNVAHVLRVRAAREAGDLQIHEILDRQVQTMARLLNDLLDVSRITRGTVPLQRGPVEIAAVVHRAVEGTRHLIDARGHALEVTLPEEPMWVVADPVRLAQVISNLLNNAAKYTAPGGTLWLTIEPRGADVWLTVRDNGIGISPEFLPRVFDLFVQGEQSLDRSEGGFGIGLTLVRRLVEMHGGAVVAKSAGLGKGSEFIVRLPLAVPQTASQTEPAAPAPPLREGLRILVVDDNTDAATTLSDLVARLGCEVRTAADGDAGIAAACEFKPDVVLLDIGLPGMDGYEVATRLRRQHGLEQVRVVAITGYGSDASREQASRTGFDRYLVKPVALAALQDALARSAALERHA